MKADCLLYACCMDDAWIKVHMRVVQDDDNLGYELYSTLEDCKGNCVDLINCYSIEYKFDTGSKCEKQTVNWFTSGFDIATWREYSNYDHHFKCGKYPCIQLPPGTVSKLNFLLRSTKIAFLGV